MEHHNHRELGTEGNDQQQQLRTQLLQGVLAAYDREYAMQNAEFGNIDRKAQATITVGGIFLAAALAFLKLDELSLLIAKSGVFLVYIIGSVVLLLVASILLCTVAMRERWILGPLKAEAYQGIVNDLVTLDPQELNPARIDNFSRDQIRVWQQTTTAMERVLNRKAKWVYWGQLFLIAAIVLAAVLLLLTLRSALRIGGGSG